MAGSSSPSKTSSGKVKGSLRVSMGGGAGGSAPVSVSWSEALSRGADMPATATMIGNVNFNALPLDQAKMTRQYTEKFGGPSGRYDLITSVNPAGDPVYLIVPKLTASPSPATQTRAQIEAAIETNRQKVIAINNQMSKFFAGSSAAKNANFASIQKQQQALWDENDALQSQLKNATP